MTPNTKTNPANGPDCTNCGKQVDPRKWKRQQRHNPSLKPACSKTCRDQLRLADGGTCDNCGKVLGKRQKYNQKRTAQKTIACSMKCRNILSATAPNNPSCEWCGKKLTALQETVQKRKGRTKLGCSDECRVNLDNPPVTCAACGEQMTAHRWMKQQTRGQHVPACSRKCRSKLRYQDNPPKPGRVVKGTFADCEVCGKQVPARRFYKLKAAGEPYTCTPACARTSNNTIDWQAFFKTDDWQKVMDEVMTEPEDAA